MAKLPKFTLSKEEGKKDPWVLRNDKTHRIVEKFETKAEATEGGVLREAVGDNGGSVKIQKENGRIQEERTFPKSQDPPESKG